MSETAPETSPEAALERVVGALSSIVPTTPVWPQGLVNPGGPHRRLKGHKYPISIGEDECLVFGRLIEALTPAHCYIIGNAFGFSSVYIADVMQHHGGQSVTTLDNQSEGDGERMAAIAQQLSEKLGTDKLLHNRKGSAPQDIAATAAQESYELIFIDGLHRHPQVTHDFDGVLPYVGDETVVVFHDSWIVGVPEAVDAAKARGFRCLWVPTSCEMILATRSEAVFARLRSTFPSGIEDKGRRSYVYGYLLYLREVASFHLDQLTGKYD